MGASRTIGTVCLISLLAAAWGCGGGDDPAGEGGGGGTTTPTAAGGTGGTSHGGSGGEAGAGGGSAGGYSGAYADLSLWACHPDRTDSVCNEDLTAVEVHPDGSTSIVDHSADPNPAADCFYVYPTVDLRLTPGNHEDLTNDVAPRRTTLQQAARLTERCRVYAPLYRQATLGCYLIDRAVAQPYFDIAYADVLDAFEYYLAEKNDGRGFVLYGHSQGAQIVSRLVRERVEPDAGVLERMVAAHPIGWPIATDLGGSTGGSFATVPVCAATDEVGCATSYRSYAAQNGFITDAYREGDVGICVHPGDVPGGGPALLSRTYLPAQLTGAGSHPPGVASQAPFVLYRNLYRATCVEQDGAKALEVALASEPGDQRSSPLDFDLALFQGTTGTHLYDVHLALGDLIDLMGAEIDAYAAR